MEKKIKIIIILLFSILLSACGFKKINDGQSTLYIQNINITGEDRNTYLLKNNILLFSNQKSQNRYDVQIALIQTKTSKIKNKSGRTERYDLKISADLKLTDIDNNKSVKKLFSRKNDYEVAKSHSDTIFNEKKASKITIDQLSEEIINFLTLLEKNK